jgi:hypothetical protein
VTIGTERSSTPARLSRPWYKCVKPLSAPHVHGQIVSALDDMRNSPRFRRQPFGSTTLLSARHLPSASLPCEPLSLHFRMLRLTACAYLQNTPISTLRRVLRRAAARSKLYDPTCLHRSSQIICDCSSPVASPLPFELSLYFDMCAPRSAWLLLASPRPSRMSLIRSDGANTTLLRLSRLSCS